MLERMTVGPVLPVARRSVWRIESPPHAELTLFSSEPYNCGVNGGG